MKKRYTIGLAILMLILPAVGNAADCNNVDIPGFLSPVQKIQKVRDALSDYAQGGIYGICFQMDSSLKVSATAAPFELIIPSSETKNVYVKGLKIENSETSPIMENLLKVKHSGSGEVVFEDFDFQNIRKGLLLEGAGKVFIKSSKFSGEASKYGPCVEVQTGGALLDGIDVSMCAAGISVKANNVKINNSKSWENKIGVNIASGIVGTDIQKTQIYGNDDGDPLTSRAADGIRIEDKAPHALAFYDLVDGEPVPVDENSESVELTGKDVNVLVPIPAGDTASARVEFYFSGGTSCGAVTSTSGQAACYVGEGISNPVEFNAATLEKGKISIEVPPEHYDKAIVAIYTDPELGTAGISQRFNVKSGGVVAFVANPYDIPTSGGAVDTGTSGSSDDDDDSDSATTGASSMGGEGAMAEGGGGIISAAGAAGGCGGGSSLMGLAWHDASLGGILWCLLLALGSIASMRMVQVKVRRKQ